MITDNTSGPVDSYISTFPKEMQVLLSKVRKTIQKAAPAAEETIAYGIPTFRLNGNLVHFAGFENHIGFYPSPAGISAFQKDLKPYKQGKGSVQFPLSELIPYRLIEKITKYRVEQNLSKEK